MHSFALSRALTLVSIAGALALRPSAASADDHPRLCPGPARQASPTDAAPSKPTLSPRPLIFDAPTDLGPEPRGGSCSAYLVRLDLILCADYSSAYSDAARDRAVVILNQAFVPIRSQLNLSCKLVRIYQFVGADPFSASTDATVFIESVRTWKNANVLESSLGAAIALTARTFDLPLLGLAYQNGLCTSMNNVGVFNEPLPGNQPFAAISLAHQLGHLAGISHDGFGNACPTTGFIMAPSLMPPTLPSGFSSCSITYWNAFRPTAACVLTNPPQQRGDANCDCVTDLRDVPHFVLGLVDPAAYAASHPGCNFSVDGDTNFDGLTNAADIQAFIGTITS